MQSRLECDMKQNFSLLCNNLEANINRKYQMFRCRTNSVLKMSSFLSMHCNDSSEVNADNEINEEKLLKYEDISRDFRVKIDYIKEQKVSENSFVLQYEKNRKIMKPCRVRNSFLILQKIIKLLE